MKRYLGIDGIQQHLADAGWYCLGVVGIIVCFMIMIVSLVVIYSVIHPANAQPVEPLVLWQLGACSQKPGDPPACVALGKPLFQDVCEAMKKRLVIEGFPGRPVCARVLVDAED
jgi:hypothetical protein